MNHDEVAELLGAYALHALDPDERALVDEHLEGCPRCRAEVRDHERVAALLGNSGGTAPDGLWDRIASTLEEAPPPMRIDLRGDGATVVPLNARRRRSRAVIAGVIAAAAAVLIAVLGVQVLHQGHRIDHLETALEGDTAVRAANVALLDPSARRVQLSSVDGALKVPAVVLPNGSGYLLAQGMPALAADRTYQLWGQTDAGLVSLGVLGAHPDVVAFQAAKGVTALAVTDERAPGVVRSSHTPTVAGKLV